MGNKATRGPFGLGFLAWRQENGEAAAAATLSAAPARMLWPARKGDHAPTAMSVLLRGKAKEKVQGHHSSMNPWSIAVVLTSPHFFQTKQYPLGRVKIRTIQLV